MQKDIPNNVPYWEHTAGALAGADVEHVAGAEDARRIGQ